MPFSIEKRNNSDTTVLAGDYTLHVGLPDILDYLRLREASGLTPRSVEAARAGLPKSVFGVHVRYRTTTVGMGRIIGDGALFMHVVDVDVLPDHQGQGIGQSIMAALLQHIESSAPAEVYVSLMANGDAHRLYAKFGFGPVTPDAQGMALWIGKQI